MLPAIKLYYQFSLVTVKVDNVVAYDPLTVHSQPKCAEVFVPK